MIYNILSLLFKTAPWQSLTLKKYSQFMEVVHVVPSCILFNEMGDQKQTFHSQQSHVCFLNMLLQCPVYQANAG